MSAVCYLYYHFWLSMELCMSENGTCLADIVDSSPEMEIDH